MIKDIWFWRQEYSFNQFFYAMFKDSPQQVAVHEVLLKLMTERLNNNRELIDKLVPHWKVGCRRLTPGDGYLEAIQEPNARCDFDPIIRITESGIETSNGLEEFDIIIAATGFDVSFKPNWKLIGANGKCLEKDWADNPEAYFGICAPDVPNYFIFNGPNSPVGHGSLLSVMEWTAQYILKWVKKIATEDIRYSALRNPSIDLENWSSPLSLSHVAVKQTSVNDYNVYSQEFLKRTVWTSGCRSWYKNGKIDGKVTAMYAGSMLHYKGQSSLPYHLVASNLMWYI